MSASGVSTVPSQVVKVLAAVMAAKGLSELALLELTLRLKPGAPLSLALVWETWA